MKHHLKLILNLSHLFNQITRNRFPIEIASNLSTD